MIDFEFELKKFMGEKRYNHSLAVQKECVSLGKLFKMGSKDIEELSVAGYLHDITKEKTLDEHIFLCKKYGIKYDKEELLSPKVFHSRTGAYLARELYPEYVNDNVFQCIMNHTTGKPNMSLSEKIVYLADYIEPTRKHSDCKKLRMMFYDIPSDCNLMDHLDDILIKSFDMTIKDLIEDEKLIDSNTIAARNSLIISKRENGR